MIYFNHCLTCHLRIDLAVCFYVTTYDLNFGNVCIKMISVLTSWPSTLFFMYNVRLGDHMEILSEVK